MYVFGKAKFFVLLNFLRKWVICYKYLSFTAGVDYTNTVATMVTFSSGQTEASYPIPIVDDNIIESTKTFTASLNTAESKVTIGNGTATITVVDEDSELFL